jgi:eukaryotic-like serine/threonine-protein kinase
LNIECGTLNSLLPPGSTILHFTVLEKLGEGGMGVVYKARDTRLDRIVALKFLSPHLTASEADRTRFIQEARAAASLSHPSVCSIIDILESDTRPFIVMEFVDGTTLHKLLPVQSVDQAITFVSRIGEALQAAHAAGIVHRDIKTENIMVTSDGRVKVMDFGLARIRNSMSMTRSGSTVGTLAYMAPEQMQGGAVDARSDIFSLGVVLFETLAGRLPFNGEHDAAVMYSILNEEPVSLLSVRPEVSPELDRIIRRALEKDAADRYQHVDDFVSELGRLQRQTGKVQRPPPVDVLPAVSAQAKAAGNRGAGRGRTTLVAFAAALVALGIAGYLLFGRPSSRIAAIAVMPFVNTTADSSMEYLSDGFTEALINRLSRLHGVKMMSRNSVFRYKGKEIDPREVGKRLGVGAIVIGNIAQRGDVLDVSVEMVSTEDESHLWGDRYNRPVAAIGTLQSEIAGRLSKELQLSLSGDEERELGKQQTRSPEAYQEYLRGKFHLNRRNTADFKKALEHFQNAVRLDPQFAIAHAHIGDCYGLMSSYFLISPSEARTRGKAEVLRALEIDPDLAEGHTSLGSLLGDFEWDWAGAEEHYRRGIELNPNYGTAHQWYAEFLAGMGRHEESVEQARLATEVDPLSPIVFVTYGEALRSAGRIDEARVQYAKSLELDQRFPRAYSSRAFAGYEQKDFAGAISDMRQALIASDSSEEYLAGLGFLYAQSGDRGRAQEILDRLLGAAAKGYLPPYNIAIVYAGLGDADNAFHWLDRAFEERSFTLEFLRVDPAFTPLRNDRRFAELVRKVGLP